jgi:hypothetical protein
VRFNQGLISNQIVRELVDIVGLSGNNDEFSGSLWENLLTSAWCRIEHRRHDACRRNGLIVPGGGLLRRYSSHG